jgi:hypothetical protein
VPVLQLLGTRFVIVPAPLRDDPAITLVLHDGADYLYEVRDANVGQWSTTMPIEVRDFPEMFKALQGAVDLRREVFVFEKTPARLVPSTVHISVESGGIAVRGSSAGTSLVVLPFTYSHCYRLSPTSTQGNVRLIRADLNLLGLMFSGDVDTSLQMSTGPFDQPGCMLADMQDFRRLGLPQLVRTIHRGALASSAVRDDADLTPSLHDGDGRR